MKRILSVVLAVVLLLPVQARAQEETPEVSAQACVLIEAVTGEVLYEKNAFEKRSMASTTKIMTTLLTLESGNLDVPFPVDNAAIHVEGSSMGLQENDVVTKRALCYGMLLPSGNDAANAAAVAIAGSIPAFAELMNERAKEIGMTRTCFVTPSGLEGEGHGASAYDMALLAREAMQNEDFRSICSQTSARVSFGNPPYERTLRNTNKLLTMYDGVIGVKTGFTDEAGRCLVSACERDGVMLICVTLHAPDDWNDHSKLYDHGFSRVKLTELPVPEGLAQPVAGGVRESVSLRIAEPVTFGAENGVPEGVATKVLLSPFAFAPVKEGDVLGTLEYYYNDRRIASAELLAAEDVPFPEQTEPEGWLERLVHWFGFGK